MNIPYRYIDESEMSVFPVSYVRNNEFFDQDEVIEELDNALKSYKERKVETC